MSFLFAFLATALGKWIVGAGVVILALVGSYIKGHFAGSKAEKAKQAEADATARDVSDHIDDAIAGRSPDQNRNKLKDWAPK